MVQPSISSLVEELKRGDRHGCRHLVERYYERLVREGTGVFRLAREDVEEIVDDTMLAVVEGVQRFTFRNGEEDFHYWVMAVFRNKLRDHVRRMARDGRLLSLCALEEEGREKSVGIAASLLEEYQREVAEGEVAGRPSALLERVGEVLDSMETWERVLLRCRALEVPYEEIAVYTGKPVYQLKVYHARVRARFERLLRDYFARTDVRIGERVTAK